MGNLLNTYQLIADILSFKSNDVKLELKLKNEITDWDSLVKVGSKHLVLPAIYCQLKAKNSLNLLPEDLVAYLKEITAINRNRNLTLIEEAQQISQLLDNHNIKHVFLKGIALINGGFFSDKAERMVGDIDILVPQEDLQRAFNAIKDNGYSKTVGFAYNNTGHRHLDRLIDENKLAAIELHSGLFDKKNQNMIDLDLFFKTSKHVNNLPIPKTTSILEHLILSWQINDQGCYYNTISFKSLYDCLVLKFNQKDLKNTILKNKYSNSYFRLAKIHFLDFKNIPTKQNKIKVFFYNLKLKSLTFRSIERYVKEAFAFLAIRIHLFFVNKSYRKHIINKFLFLRSN